ncbi:phage terminase large subunit [Gibbsiella quercinecans]|uniref:phage terminase large subunit n=1 Tax=Gibbsiella quercinecans TaxID=929813 RepID=UPI0024305386|nr:phage terminase large subunit [Gibbsiella quercinecans]
MLLWEELTPTQKLAIKQLSKTNFEKMIQIWFQLIQAQKFSANWHHRYLCHEVEEIIAGRRGNTIFNVTPGSGKTEVFSIHLPVYAMINLAKVRNLNVSFADSLVKRNSKRVREIISSNEFQELWPCSFGTSKDDEIQVLNSFGKVWFELISKAAGGQITGSRGGYMTDVFSGMVMLDDIDKPDDMFSKVKRERTHTLLKNTIRSRRMHDGTPIIAIQQRLHTQDSTWFMLNGGMGIEFDQVSIPALVTEEYGKSLPDWLQPIFERDVLSSEYVEIDGVKHYSFWPDKESVHDLMALREADYYTFQSQYQQEPITLGGNVFNSEWWRYYGSSLEADEPHPDKFEYRFITADTAQKTGELNDFSVIIEWGKLKDRVYFIDGIRGKWEAPDLATHFEAFTKAAWRKNKAIGVLRKIYVEDKASGTGLIQDVGKRTPVKITALQRNKDKVTRAMDAQPVIKAGRVVLPESHDMLAEFIAEHSSFTYDDTHKHDDICDNTFDAVTEELLMSDDPIERMKRLAGLNKRG